MTSKIADTDDRPVITVLIPVYNEQRNVRRAYDAVVKVFEGLPRYRLELLFNDNHSEDGTMMELEALAATDHRVKVVRLARNFGFERSVLTGYRLASGAAAVQLDCDLQDPPEIIPMFIEKWEEGYDVVVGIRKKREESFFLQFGRRIFYRLISHISNDNLVDDAGDFRLVDRSVLKRLAEVNDAQPYTRGLVSSLAARQTGIAYDRRSRLFEKSKFPLRRLTGFAAHGIVSHSLVPLRLASYLGLLIFFGTLSASFYYAIAWAVGSREWPAGFATTTILLLISLGLNSIFIGIVGEYVGRIFEQVRTRPLTIVERTINLSAKGGAE